MKTSPIFSLIAFATLASACAGQTADVGTQASTQQAGSGQVGAAAVRSTALDDICDSAHGPIDALTQLGQINPHLAGKWYRCDVTGGTPWTKTGQGIELVPDADNSSGSFYALDFDADGTAVREQGLDGSGTYSIGIATDTFETFPYADTVPFSSMQVWSNAEQAAANGNMTTHYFEFETNPRRMRMDGTIWFVSAP